MQHTQYFQVYRYSNINKQQQQQQQQQHEFIPPLKVKKKNKENLSTKY